MKNGKYFRYEFRYDKNMILCDIGNSYYHFFKDGASQKMKLDAIPRIKNIDNIDKVVYYISVNKEAEKSLLKYNECINLENIIQIESSYNQKEMGIDRKVACYGASDCVIIDAGSAITVDIIHNKKHIGGFILPGLSAMIGNMSSISNVLEIDINLAVNLNNVPKNKIDAISFGILKPIEIMIKYSSKDKNIIFTGGDGKFFSKFFEKSIYNERLIFNNMVKIVNSYKLKEKI